MASQFSCPFALTGAVLSLLAGVCLAQGSAKKPAVPSKPAKEVQAANLVLTQNGATRYVIALPADAIPAEKTAARELSEYLEKISGAAFAVKTEADVADQAPQILIGAGDRVKKLLPNEKWAPTGTDSIVIKTSGNKLILAGSRPRGALYATYTFLEDTLGVRWWTPTESTIPRRATIELAPLNRAYTPKLQTREAYYRANLTAERTFPAHLKLNGGQRYSYPIKADDPTYGGHNMILGWCHTFSQLLPPETYFAKHPEWYSDSSNGNLPATANSPMPRPQATQLCLSNEEARRELTKNALQWIRNNPNAGTISISQNDTITDHCQCPADVAVEKAEGSPSGPLLHFVNQVAADIEKEFPGFLVETLAYNYTQKPPLYERPRRNVVIRLCSANGDTSIADDAKPFTHPNNAAFRDDLLGWKAIAPRLYIWKYVTNFVNYLVPQPNLATTGPDMRFLVDNNTISLFAQGDSSNEAGDFISLRIWLLAHLMWDPSLEQRKVESEFLHGYYGAAAPHLRAYLDVIQKSGTNHKVSQYETDYSYLTLDILNAATLAFRRAEAAVAGNEVLSRRVLRERLVLDNAWITRYEPAKQEAAARKIKFEGPQNLPAFIEAYARNGHELGIREKGMDVTFDSYSAHLLGKVGPQAPLPAFALNRKDDDVLDVQEGSFTLYEKGTLTSLVDDPKASNGRAAKMLGNSNIWGVQLDLSLESEALRSKSNWHGYIMVRVEPTEGAPKTGNAFATGLYEAATRKEFAQIIKPAAEVADNEYQVYDLGSHPLTKNTFVWVAPTTNPNIAALYVDRVIFVRE